MAKYIISSVIRGEKQPSYDRDICYNIIELNQGENYNRLW